MNPASDPMWRRICCPVDFSEPSRRALEKAIEVARVFGAELLLVHVRDESGGPATMFAPPAHPSPRPDQGPDLLLAWAEHARRSVPVTTTVEPGGSAAEEIIKTVHDFACDLIVMGTHGRTGFRRAVLGSVTEHVVRNAPCPVLVVNATDE